MERPKLGAFERVRVELRLPQRIAEGLYRYATESETTLSGAGADLIEAGLASLEARTADTGTSANSSGA